MPTGTKLLEEVKQIIANRAHNGEDKEEIAKEFNVAVSTVEGYMGKYPKKRKVKRKVAIQPKQNTRVSDAEVKGLREEVQRLRNLLLEEILRNRGQ